MGKVDKILEGLTTVNEEDLDLDLSKVKYIILSKDSKSSREEIKIVNIPLDNIKYTQKSLVTLLLKEPFFNNKVIIAMKSDMSSKGVFITTQDTKEHEKELDFFYNMVKG